jgi:aspartate-semialdehyde dehydrogenase
MILLILSHSYFSTSNAGGEAPSFGGKTAPALMEATDITSLKQMDVIITCQGGDYTSEVFPKLKATGWDGWIDGIYFTYDR